MDNFFEKLSSYNILNNMLPGSIFCFLLEHVVDFTILRSNLIENLFIFYFGGMIISRIGSLIVEPIAQKTNFVIYSDYPDFVRASKSDPQIEILSETNNTYRTFVSLAFTLAISKLYLYFYNLHEVLQNITPWVVLLILLCIFLASYKKQTKYVLKRVKKVNEMIDGGEL